MNATNKIYDITLEVLYKTYYKHFLYSKTGESKYLVNYSYIFIHLYLTPIVFKYMYVV